MATTAIWGVSDNLKRVLEYTANPDKTLDETTGEWGLDSVLEYVSNSDKAKHFVSGINCSPLSVLKEMQTVKEIFLKEKGILAFHGYQSFAENEVTPELAHKIGIELATRLWGNRFQVLVTTHIDIKSHIHNHFVLNSISFVDGQRYYGKKSTYKKMRSMSDQLCQEYKLSVITNPKRKGKHYAEWQAEKVAQPTWRTMIAADVDLAISQSRTYTQFLYQLRKMGYDVKASGVKYVAIRPKGKERFVRLKTLGNRYTEENIKQLLLFEGTSGTPIPIPKYKIKSSTYKKFKIAGLRAIYIRYLYKLGILPNKKKNVSNKRIHFLYRDSINKMLKISEEAKLLNREKIGTIIELQSYKGKVMNDLQHNRKLRKDLFKQIRKSPSEQLEAELSVLQQRIFDLRKEVGLCDSIEERSKEIKDKFKQEREETQEEKENECRRRSR